MGYFKRTLHHASDNNQWYYVYEPTVMKKGAIFIKGKNQAFVKNLKRKPR